MLPGGRAPEYLRLNPKVLDMVRHFDEQKKLAIAAICHGAQLLTAAGVVKGTRLSAYRPAPRRSESAGGTYVPVGMTEAVVDGPLVTAPAWPAHPAWLAKFLEVLEEAAKSQRRGRELQETR